MKSWTETPRQEIAAAAASTAALPAVSDEVISTFLI